MTVLFCPMLTRWTLTKMFVTLFAIFWQIASGDCKEAKETTMRVYNKNLVLLCCRSSNKVKGYWRRRQGVEYPSADVSRSSTRKKASIVRGRRKAKIRENKKNDHLEKKEKRVDDSQPRILLALYY